MNGSPTGYRSLRANRRAISSAIGAIILAVIVVVGGVGAFLATSATTSPTHSCTPSTSPVCIGTSNLHDVTVLAPLKAALQGTPVPFTAQLPGGEVATSYNFNFGDGAYQNDTTSGSYDHTYASPGTYLVQVSADVGGVLHDNDHAITSLVIQTSYASDIRGIYPTDAGSILSNSTSSASSGSPTALLHVGQSITVEGQYTLSPTSPGYSLGTPSLVATGGVTPTGYTVTASSAQGTFTFSTAGTYLITYVGTGVSASAPTAYENYTWTVDVAPTGTGLGLAGTSTTSSPHPGTIIAYEDQPGGATTFDPAIDYDVAGFEVLLNVYQTLIQYNGTEVGPSYSDYVPVIATCVPGSPQCTSLYGNSLLNGTNYTFVISKSAHYYDHATGADWEVYPSDVVFSMLRTMGFSQYPGLSVTPGWIQTEALLPAGNGSWDNGTHATFNNTPQYMFASMSVNASPWCPAIALTEDNGCVTFHANATNSFGSSWPYFLELIADPEGAGIVPCGWFSEPAQGQGIPGWTLENASDQGDHSCAMPTASQIAAMSPTSLDNWETSYVNSNTGAYVGDTQWNTVGSGPYYLVNTQVHYSYTLAANPYYEANPSCTGGNCLPAPGTYVPNIEVYWEQNPSAGEQAIASGAADVGYIPSTDTDLLLQLGEQGKTNSIILPTLGLNVLSFTFNFSVAREHTYTSNPVNIPSTWFSNLGVRQFFTHAYPYATIESEINTKDGIQYGFDVGGAIPQFMSNYYPSNVPWPNGTPDTNANDIGGAAWWWAQVTENTSSPYYDAWTATHCLPSSPCEFPIYGELGAPDEDQRLTLYIQSVSQLTHGAVEMSLVDLTQTEETEEGTDTGGPGTSALPMLINLWLPDFPDPSDYTVPFYTPDAFFTYPTAVGEQFAQPQYNTTLPGTTTPCPTDYNYWVNNSVPQSCQGAAYSAMIILNALAGALPAGPLRVLWYDEMETIANKLAIMVDEYQSNYVETFASWLYPPSLETNVINVGDYVWYYVTGNNVLPPSSS